MRFFLTGATGYVGKNILGKLLEHDYHVTTLVRKGSESKIEEFIGHHNLHIVHGDLTKADHLKDVLTGIDVVIHLVGIIRERRSKNITFQNIHVGGTQNLVAEAKRAQVKRFIHMSALGARPAAVSLYHKSKYEGEQFVIESGIPYTIFQPSIIFGPHDEFVNMLAGLVKAPISPVIGNGHYRLQPVSVHTIATIFTQAATLEQTINQIYEVGGPDRLSYNHILDLIGKTLGKNKVRKFHAPLWLMKPVVKLMDGIPAFPITSSQLTMLLEENICNPAEDEKFRRDFSISKSDEIDFASGIKQYL